MEDSRTIETFMYVSHTSNHFILNTRSGAHSGFSLGRLHTGGGQVQGDKALIEGT